MEAYLNNLQRSRFKGKKYKFIHYPDRNDRKEAYKNKKISCLRAHGSKDAIYNKEALYTSIGHKKTRYTVDIPRPSNLTIAPYTASDHFTTTMVDISPSGAWLIFVAPYGAKLSIRVEYCFSSSENKPRLS